MPVKAVCACGASYYLRDRYAGSRLACPRCGAAIEVPALPPRPAAREQPGDPVFARDKFLLNERHLGVNEKYYVTDQDGRPLLFVERPAYLSLNVLAGVGAVAAGLANLVASGFVYFFLRHGGVDTFTLGVVTVWGKLGSLLVVFLGFMSFPPKRDASIYRDDSRRETLLRIAQDRRLQLFGASYTVYDGKGTALGKLRKQRLRNILRKRWYCLSPEGEVLFIAREDSMVLSLLRRFLLGFFGLLRTDFLIYGPRWRVLGEFDRRFTLLDRYVLDLGADGLRTMDRRLALAMGVILDTGENR